MRLIFTAIAFSTLCAFADLYRAPSGFVNLDSARQSTIEACGPNDEAIVKTMAEEEDRLGKAAASPNSLNLTERGITPPKANISRPSGLKSFKVEVTFLVFPDGGSACED